MPIPGAPPPHKHAFALNSNLLGHYYRWARDAQMDMNFLPERHSFVVNGRPVQSLVLTHNRAPPHEYEPYMQFALRPLNPLVLVGVSGGSKEAPFMEPYESVIEWWKACVHFPYIFRSTFFKILFVAFDSNVVCIFVC